MRPRSTNININCVFIKNKIQKKKRWREWGEKNKTPTEWLFVFRNWQTYVGITLHGSPESADWQKIHWLELKKCKCFLFSFIQVSISISACLFVFICPVANLLEDFEPIAGSGKWNRASFFPPQISCGWQSNLIISHTALQALRFNLYYCRT